MRCALLLLLLCGCSSAIAVEPTGDDEIIVAILDAEYEVKQNSVPDLPDSLSNSREEPEESPELPRAYLITANFHCPPCEVWKSRIDELPFRVKVQVKSRSPTGEFPCLWYPNARSQTGWSYWSGKSIDEFLRQYDREDGVLREAVVVRDPASDTKRRKTPEELRQLWRNYRGPVAYVQGMSYQQHICDANADSHGGEPFEPWQLDGLSVGELQKIHGAQHNGTISPFTDSESSSTAVRIPARGNQGSCANGQCAQPARRVRWFR